MPRNSTTHTILTSHNINTPNITISEPVSYPTERCFQQYFRNMTAAIVHLTSCLMSISHTIIIRQLSDASRIYTQIQQSESPYHAQLRNVCSVYTCTPNLTISEPVSYQTKRCFQHYFSYITAAILPYNSFPDCLGPVLHTPFLPGNWLSSHYTMRLLVGDERKRSIIGNINGNINGNTRSCAF